MVAMPTVGKLAKNASAATLAVNPSEVVHTLRC